MPLRRRLLALVALVLALCLVAGGALTYWQGLRKIELEMSSAIEVADSAVGDAMSTIGASPDAAAYLHRIITSFDGDRHVVARLMAPTEKWSTLRVSGDLSIRPPRGSTNCSPALSTPDVSNCLLS